MARLSTAEAMKSPLVEVLGALELPKSASLLVPEVGIEPTRVIHPLDFESSASTSFTTPARAVHTRGSLEGCQYDIDRLGEALVRFMKWGCSSAGRAHDWQS
jgi:hypothetical protein